MIKKCIKTRKKKMLHCFLVTIEQKKGDEQYHCHHNNYSHYPHYHHYVLKWREMNKGAIFSSNHFLVRDELFKNSKGPKNAFSGMIERLILEIIGPIIANVTRLGENLTI